MGFGENHLLTSPYPQSKPSLYLTIPTIKTNSRPHHTYDPNKPHHTHDPNHLMTSRYLQPKSSRDLIKLMTQTILFPDHTHDPKLAPGHTIPTTLNHLTNTPYLKPENHLANTPLLVTKRPKLSHDSPFPQHKPSHDHTTFSTWITTQPYIFAISPSEYNLRYLMNSSSPRNKPSQQPPITNHHDHVAEIESLMIKHTYHDP